VTVADFGPAPANWCWQSIGEDEAFEQWRQLASWVGWLRCRYPIADQLPACWWRHSELVEELTAVWLAWHAAYTEPRGQLTAPVDFHDRVLPSFLPRVRRWGVQCLDEHRPRPASVYGNEAVDDPEAFADFTGDPCRGDLAGGEPGRSRLDFLPLSAVRCLVDEGFAVACSPRASSAVRIHQDYWLPTGTGYARVSDPALQRQLRRDDARHGGELAQQPAPQGLDREAPPDEGAHPGKQSREDDEGCEPPGCGKDDSAEECG
jgi:hypothetical protein